MTITDEQIERTEKILLKSNIFNIQQREFIRCIDKSIDLVACPGSGKTTALLSKLIILSEYLPFEKNRGICVLTHTNVAINEIKQKLGSQSDVLFSYPNFFGTIQSFVDTYLFIPFWTVCQGIRPWKIENESYINSISKRAFYKNILTGFDEQIITGKNYYLKVNDHFIYSYRIRRENGDLKVYDSINGKIVNFNKPRSKTDWTDEIKEKIQNWFIKYKIKTHLTDNVFSYDDAYFFSLEYIEKFISIIPSVQKRFKFVFVDEMQDTDIHQFEIINKLFPLYNDNPIVQCIGDPNQSIFTATSKSENGGWAPDFSNLERTMFLSNSIRFGSAIADRVKYVCANDISASLQGNNSINSIVPHLILYTDTTPKETVLKKFIELIVKYNILPDKLKPFKAIGSVGKESDKITIKSYFDDFCSKDKIEQITFHTLLSFLKKPKPELVRIKGSKIYSEIIWEMILKILEIGEKKINKNGREYSYSKTTLIKELSERDEDYFKKLLQKIAEWVLGLYSSHAYDMTLYNNIKRYLQSDFIPFMSIPYNKVQNFLDDCSIDSDFIKTNKYNKYTCVDYPGIEVEIATIHSIKGETHKATLYLDTFFHKLDSQQIKNQIKGIVYAQGKAPDINKKRTLKLAHVAMSRPTDLLCFACDKNIFTDDELTAIDYKNNQINGWILEYC